MLEIASHDLPSNYKNVQSPAKILAKIGRSIPVF